MVQVHVPQGVEVQVLFWAPFQEIRKSNQIYKARFLPGFFFF